MHRTSTLTIKSAAQTGEKLGARTKAKIAFVYFPNRSIRHRHQLSGSGKAMVAQNGENAKPEPTTATCFICRTLTCLFPALDPFGINMCLYLYWSTIYVRVMVAQNGEMVHLELTNHNNLFRLPQL
jgi:hypothetical protein